MTRLRSDKSKKGGIDLLQRISAKDLRDVGLEVLIDHMLSSVRTDAETFRNYVRNPRVSNEMLTPYKGFFRKVVSKADMEAYAAQPMKLVEWVAENIRVDKNCNLGLAILFLPKACGERGWRMRIAGIFSLYPWRVAWVYLRV